MSQSSNAKPTGKTIWKDRFLQAVGMTALGGHTFSNHKVDQYRAERRALESRLKLELSQNQKK